VRRAVHARRGLVIANNRERCDSSCDPRSGDDANSERQAGGTKVGVLAHARTGAVRSGR